jgi:uncharacterized membrane-anchored protein YitT (DUF2179 family)
MNIPKWVSDSFFIVIGCVCFALGVAAFLIPSQIVAGGPPGIAVLFNNIANLHPGLVILVVNGGLILLGLRTLGLQYVLRTLMAVVAISTLTGIFLSILDGYPFIDNRILSALCAGVLLGAGIALIFKGGAASGGWAMLVRLVSNHTGIKVGNTAVLLDASVVLLSAMLIGGYQTALLGCITVYTSGKVINTIMTPPRRVRQSGLMLRKINMPKKLVASISVFRARQCDVLGAPTSL